MFSPYYAWARRNGSANPLDHCAFNVALYGPRSKQWAMTERSSKSVARDQSTLAIGPSSIRWHADALTLTIDERTMPWLGRVRGKIRLSPAALPRQRWSLAEQGLHWWEPIAPVSRIEVALSEPSLNWSGEAYFDSNKGDSPLEDTFTDWDWSRASHRKGTAALYDVRRRDGTTGSLALRFDPSGGVETFPPPSVASLPRTLWGVSRGTRSNTGTAKVIRTLEDTPFYARSLVETEICGERALAMHESLSLKRFATPIVQCMLPFRMPRKRG